MQKRKLTQRFFALSLAAAMSLSIVSLPEIKSNAAPISGASISVNETTVDGQTTTGWTFKYNNNALKKAAYTRIKAPADHSDSYTESVTSYTASPYWNNDAQGNYVYTVPGGTVDCFYNYSFTHPIYRRYTKVDAATGKTLSYVAEGSKTYYGDYSEPKLYIMVYNQSDWNTKTNTPATGAKPEGGITTVDDAGKSVISTPYYTLTYKDPADETDSTFDEFEIDSMDFAPGKKVVVGYILDEPAYQEALLKAKEADYKDYLDEYCKVDNSDTPANQRDYPEVSDFDKNQKAVSKSAYYQVVNPTVIDISMEAKISPTVTATTVKLALGATSKASGYQIWRKVGKKWVKVGTVSSQLYTDKGLESNTTYTYRVRAYYVNQKTNTVSYGKYNTCEVTTTGSALNLKASITSKNKVKLTWKKVSKATKYQIYRVDTTSNASSVSKGESNGFDSSKLIATVKKNKKTYTDKTVTTNRSYTYYIRAVLPKNKEVKKDKSRYVDDSVRIDVRFGEINVLSDFCDAKGNRTIKWERVYGNKGYIIEEQVDSYRADVEKSNTYPYTYDPATGVIKTYNEYGIPTGGYLVSAAEGKVYNGYINPDSGEFVSNGVLAYLYENGYIYEFKNESVYDAATATTTLVQKKTRFKWQLSGTSVLKVDPENGKIKYVLDKETWKKIKTLKSTTTSIKLTAKLTYDEYKKVRTGTTKYRIRAISGTNSYGPAYNTSTTYQNGMITTVTAKAVSNGIKITWKPVANASYYRVYRIPTSLFVKNNDIGGYDFDGDISNQYLVTDYVGVKAPVAVDVVSWNNAVDKSVAEYKAAYRTEEDAYNAAVASADQQRQALAAQGKYAEAAAVPTPVWSTYHKTQSGDYLSKSDKLNTNINYYYQNYSYARTSFTNADATAGILDYAGDIYGGTGKKDTDSYKFKNADGTETRVCEYSYNPIVKADDVLKSELQDGVKYTYFVQAFFANAYDVSDYGKPMDTTDSDTYFTEKGSYMPAYDMTVTGPKPQLKKAKDATDTNAFYWVKGGAYATKVQDAASSFSDAYSTTAGCATVGSATFTVKKAAAKPAIKKVSSKNGNVTIKIKKKIKAASYYKIYRSTKKTGKYVSVGVTSKNSKLTFTDKSATKGKTYYYKVASVVKNEAMGEIESKLSAAKKIKVK